MPNNKKVVHNRWFLEHPMYMLANGAEIRAEARKAGVRLIDGMYKTEFDVEAPGKPAEVLLDRYKKQTGSSDSNQSAPYYPEGQEPLVKMAKQRLTELHAAEVQEAEEKAEDESTKAQAAVEAAAQAAADSAKAENDAKVALAAKEAEAQTKAKAAAAEKAAAEKAASDKAAAEKAAAEAAAKAAKAKAEAEANKTIEAKAEVAEKAIK